jgi:osmoprotectant transport system permease protein
VNGILATGPVIPDFGRGDPCIRRNGRFCLHWLLDHFSDRFLPRLEEHVALTAIALGAGFLIALVAAVVAHRQGWLAGPFLRFAALLYTIPSIAAFQILVPLTGLGWLTIEIALVSYTLLVLFRNILTGLREVPADVKEAARGMGLTRRQILTRVELPLAIPSIIAGVRVAAVTTISLATIAAYITPVGLGAPIFSALQSGSNTQFIAASVLTIALALVTDALIVAVQKVTTPWAQRVSPA